MQETKRIAMWSGPRNLSTAMMYAFAQRGDCQVVDEPFYAAYLAATGIEHPMQEEVLASQPQDGLEVVAELSKPADRPLFYQKHMCQHMVPGMPRDWMADVKNVFLIRHPARVIASYAQKREAPTLADIGFDLQDALYDHCLALGQSPVVIDSYDILQNPEGMLRTLCDALEIAFDPAMLSWPAGGNAADGAWAPVWYGAVHRSTGFAGAEGPLPELDTEKAAIAQAAFPLYQRLKDVSLTL
ncbi:HAD family hydrolase [Primorskyibacter sp. S187A]|uniref:sulfotransferase-like domain-containing protein n=1 Tax=Primorskyibacter sp. S187A TaxID=3415130 RepID=UPI003C797FA8